MTSKIDKKEYEKLKKMGYIITETPKKKTEIEYLIVFVSDTRRKHDSGYPFIRIFGKGKDRELIDFGWHDHFVSEIPINVDSLAKNIFRVMVWGKHRFWIKGNNIWCSSLVIRESDEIR